MQSRRNEMTYEKQTKLQTRFPWRIFSRIVLFQAALILLALGASGLTARHFLRAQFIEQSERQLQDTLTSLSTILPATVSESVCLSYVKGTSLRLTMIDYKGRVLCDSHHSPLTMDNHAGRPEIIDAHENGYGRSVRWSDTLHQEMLYVAMDLKTRNAIWRGALPLSQLAKTLNIFDTSLAVFLIIIALALTGFAAWSGRMLLFPMGRVLLKAQGVLYAGEGTPAGFEDNGEWEKEPYGEWSQLESSLENIRQDLRTKTENLRLEREELATLMGAISDAILAVDTDGVPLFFNTRFAVLFGNGDPLKSRTIRLWEMFRAPEILEAFKAALQESRTASVKAIALDEVKGSKRFFSLSVAPLRKGSGDVYGAVGVFHDVTELKAAEQIRIDFVANVSHELRTPLTAIKGYTDTLVQDAQEGKPISGEFLAVVARNTDRLISLISDLLDLSSLESTDVMQKSQVSTAEITARVLKQLGSRFSDKKQTIDSRVNAPTVTLDPSRLEQVLVNLLDNASKYTPSGGKIEITWDREDRDIVLRVRDNGPGIPAEHHSRLFERFYRVDKARSREQGGTGLGLAIVKHILQRHGGSVSVESQMGQGSVFICRFPV